jgi:hypothetical protein
MAANFRLLLFDDQYLSKRYMLGVTLSAYPSLYRT